MANSVASKSSTNIEKTSVTTFGLQTSAINTAPTFSSGTGKLTTAVNDSTNQYRSGQGNSMALQTDGKIILAGTSFSGNWSTDTYNFGLARYNTDGSLDTSFDGDGRLVTDFGNTEYVRTVKVQADGKVLVGGYSYSDGEISAIVARYSANGVLDTGFGVGGTVINSTFNTYNNGFIALQADGKILLAGSSGTSSSDFVLARYTSSGTLDTTFGSAGLATANVDVYDQVSSVTVQTDGKILVGGTSMNGSSADFSLVRFNSDGGLDSLFGTAGKVSTSVYHSDQATSISVQTDGKILLGGYSTGCNSDFALLRYTSNGSLDTSFDGDGKLTTAFGSNGDNANSVTVQADGKILLAGVTSSCDGEFALVRYNSDGNLDTSFDGDGKLTTDVVTGRYDSAKSVIVQTDGKILLGGTSSYGCQNDFALVRYNMDGSLDTTFGTGTTLDATPTFVGKGSAVVLDNNVNITDAELKQANNYNGSSLTLSRKGTPNAQDLFGASGSLTLNGGSVKINSTTVGTYTNSAGSLVINFNNNATQDLVNAVAQQITYANTRSSASGSVEINWLFNDGSGAENAVVTGSNTVTLEPAEVIVDIAGKTNVGQILTVDNYINDPDGNGTFKYQWLANDVIIRGANSTTYKLTSADIGKTIKIVVSHVDQIGEFSSFTSDPTVAVTDLNNKPTGTVKITGNAIQGATLTASNTIVDLDGISTVGFTQESGIWYQWKANGVAINDNKFNSDDNSTLVLSQDQVGKRITVEAMYVDNQGNLETVASRATGNVVNINDAPTGGIEINDTTPQVGQVLTINNTIADADGLPTTIRYQWMADGLAIRGASSTSYTVRPSDLGKEIKVIATYTDLFGKAERVESEATSDVTNFFEVAPVNPPPMNLSSASSLLWADQLLNSSNSPVPSVNGHDDIHQESIVHKIGVTHWEFDLL